MRGQHDAMWSQELVTGSDDGVEHGFMEQIETHPLGDDDVNLLNVTGQRDGLHSSVDDLDNVAQVVFLYNLLTQPGNATGFYSKYFFGSG